MNKYYFLISLFSLCFSLRTQAQLSKKAIKEIKAQIENSYELEEYENVIFLAKELRNSDHYFEDKSFEYWFNSAYILHDLNESINCYDYYNDFIKETKINKKISIESLSRLDSLSLISSLYRKGREGFKENKNNSNTIKVFKEINKIDSQYWQTHYYLTYLYFFQNDFESVIEHGEIALKWRPELYKLNYFLAYAYFQSKEYKASILKVNELLKIDQLDMAAHELKAHSFYKLKLYHKAIESINQTIEINPNHIEYYNLKYLCELEIEKPKESINSLIEILKLDTANSTYIKTAYYFIYKQENKPDYLAILDEAIEEKPLNLNFKLLRIKFLKPQDSSDYRNGLPIFNDIIKTDTNNAHYHFLKGEFMFNAFNQKDSRKEEAHFHLLKAYEIDPFYYKTYDYICRLHMWGDSKITKKFKKVAIKNMCVKIEKEPNNSEAYFELAEAYDLPINGIGSGEKYKDSVLKYYELSMLKGMDSLKVMGQRGYILVHLKMHEEYIENYKWLLKQSKDAPYRSSANYYIVRGYRALKQYDNEKKAILNSLEENPDNKSLIKRLKEVNKLLETEK